MNIESTIEVPGLLSENLSKKLVFETDGLTIHKFGIFNASIFLPAQNLSAFRYGVNWTRGYRFIIGRQFFIEVQTDEKKINRIKLSSYYGIRKDLYAHLWSDIIQQLWQSYFVNIYNYYYDLYKIHQHFELCGIEFHADGITWDSRNTLAWHEIAINSYHTYFMISNHFNKKQCKSRSFANDWNAVILQVLLKAIVKEHNVLQS